MKIKRGAVLSGLNIKMRNALIITDQIYGDMGQELVITCGLNGTHSAGSLHYYGLAFDIRTNYFNAQDRKIAFELLTKELSYDYDVVLHSTHIHIEYDPK